MFKRITQGCVLSPILFTLYTNDCSINSSNNVNLIKFADDSTIQGLISNDDESFYKKEVNSFVSWCTEHFLLLNIKKTKELVIDFRRKKEDIKPLEIEGEKEDIVNSYKYLGITINDKLDWSDHVDITNKKLHQRLYFLRKLRKFNIDNQLLSLFYKSVIESIFSFCVICWGGNTLCKDISKINRVISKSDKICGNKFNSFGVCLNNLCIKKIKLIIQDSTHPLNNTVTISERSGRPISCKCNRERYKNSFIPSAIRLLHSIKYKAEIM